MKMHPDEIHIDLPLVKRLIADQFPQWSSLPLIAVESAGTSNAIYRLGNDMMVRMPRKAGSMHQLDKEYRWLPRLAPYLPLAVPFPLGRGVAVGYYPCTWAIYRWIEGTKATAPNIYSSSHAAVALGQFVAALQKIESTEGPAAGDHNFYRGVPLKMLDVRVRAALESLKGIIDVFAATVAWDAVLKVPAYEGPPKWIHGDLHEGNLLAYNGKLVAVIDFGGLGVGDPACDLMAAWTYLSRDTREIFRSEVGLDELSWARGRGWALYLGLVALPYYQFSNPELAIIARRSISEVLADFERRK